MRWLNQNRQISELNNSLGSLKTANFESFLDSARQRFQGYSVLYRHYGNRTFLKAKLATRIKQQKWLETVLKIMTWDGTKAVGFGDGSKFSGFKGLGVGGPMAKIRRFAIKRGYSVTLVNEDYTSKNSCCCNTVVKQAKKNKNGSEFWTNLVRGHSICQRCGRSWNRDVNAAINIWKLFHDFVRGIPRESRFCRRGHRYNKNAENAGCALDAR